MGAPCLPVLETWESDTASRPKQCILAIIVGNNREHSPNRVMTTKRLRILILLDAVAVLAVVFYFLKSQSFVPLMIGFLPFALGNFIYVKEVMAPPPEPKDTRLTDDEMRRRKQAAFPLLITPILFCVMSPTVIRSYSSLGWSPVVCIGFSVFLCIVLISAYGGVKLLLKARTG